MSKVKVKDLPQEEQDKLLNEALELDIQGLAMAQTWNVETLKSKIEAAKEAQKPAEDEQNAENAEQETENGEQNAESDEQEPAEDEQDKEPENEPEEEKAEEPEPVEAEPEGEYKICHICRSKVIKGVCTGCGFTLN